MGIIIFPVFLISCVAVSVNVGEDCPVFDGLFEFCQLSTGGSIGKQQIVILINS